MEHDPSGAGAALSDAYAKPGSVLERAIVDSLREELDRAGARTAAIAASDDCYARAVARAAGLPALESFLESWRVRRY
jgi:DNA-binding GntR family transcriptional regulator